MKTSTAILIGVGVVVLAGGGFLLLHGSGVARAPPPPPPPPPNPIADLIGGAFGLINEFTHLFT